MTLWASFLEKIGVNQNNKINWELLPDYVDKKAIHQLLVNINENEIVSVVDQNPQMENFRDILYQIIN